MKSILFAVTFILITGCSSSNNSPTNDLSGIDSCRKKYVAAWLTADADQIAKIYTDDAVVLYPNQPAIAGKAAISTYFKDFFQQFRQDSFELVSDEVQMIGSIAYDRGKYKWKGTARNGDTTVDDNGKYLVILKKQTDGTWKVFRDMDNSDRPLSQTTRE